MAEPKKMYTEEELKKIIDETIEKERAKKVVYSFSLSPKEDEDVIRYLARREVERVPKSSLIKDALRARMQEEGLDTAPRKIIKVEKDYSKKLVKKAIEKRAKDTKFDLDKYVDSKEGYLSAVEAMIRHLVHEYNVEKDGEISFGAAMARVAEPSYDESEACGLPDIFQNIFYAMDEKRFLKAMCAALEACMSAGYIPCLSALVDQMIIWHDDFRRYTIIGRDWLYEYFGELKDKMEE